MCFFEQLLVVDVIPKNQARNDAVQAVAFRLLIFLGWELLRVCRGVIDKLSEQYSAGSGQGLAGPPQVQRGRVAVADGLLS